MLCVKQSTKQQLWLLQPQMLAHIHHPCLRCLCVSRFPWGCCEPSEPLGSILLDNTCENCWGRRSTVFTATPPSYHVSVQPAASDGSSLGCAQMMHAPAHALGSVPHCVDLTHGAECMLQQPCSLGSSTSSTGCFCCRPPGSIGASTHVWHSSACVLAALSAGLPTPPSAGFPAYACCLDTPHPQVAFVCLPPPTPVSFPAVLYACAHFCGQIYWGLGCLPNPL